MRKKIVNMLLITLLIIVIVLPVLGENITYNQKNTQTTNTNNIEFKIDINNTTSNLDDIFEIYEGQLLIFKITVRWYPSDTTKTICLWADNTTMPLGATLTPPCNCSPGETYCIFQWTPAIGQAGTYHVRFFSGPACGNPYGIYIVTIIVHSSEEDNPPIVVIQSPENQTTFNKPNIKLTGYASDDIGLISIMFHHEWTDNEAIISATLPTIKFYPFNQNFNLYEGWNRITVTVSDTKNQKNNDQIVIYYENLTNQPPNKPSKPSGSTYGHTGISYTYESVAIDVNDDNIYYMFDWDDATNTGWIGPYNSGDTCEISHIWTSRGSYSIKVKAKDIHDAESVWSDPLPITMPKTYNNKQIIQNFLKNIICHPFFEKIINQII